MPFSQESKAQLNGAKRHIGPRLKASRRLL